MTNAESEETMTEAQADKMIALLTAIDSKLQTLAAPIGSLQAERSQPRQYPGPREFSQDEIERRSRRFYQADAVGAMRPVVIPPQLPERY